MKIVKDYSISKILITVLFLFIFSVSLRIWDLNSMGRVWDEQSLAEKGYLITRLIENKDFSNKFWYLDAADHPVFAFYFIGIASRGDLIKYDPSAPTTFSPGSFGAPVFHYDLTYARLLSVFISSLSVVLIFFIGLRFFSYFVGLASGVILAMLPHYLGYSQMVELEAWIVLFFSLCAFLYMLYLDSGKKSLLILTGIFTGILLQIKQSNALILFFYLGSYLIWRRNTKNKKIKYSHFIIMGLIALGVGFLVYPMPFFHLPEFIGRNADWLEGGLVPELIFGKLTGARSYYYVLAFFITTPVLILLATFLGLKISFDKRKLWIYSVLILWFFVPFLITFFHMRQHMIRYLIEFYVPLSILSAIGLEYVSDKFSKKTSTKYIALFIIFVYLFLSILKIKPYYLSYYNELVGGTRGVHNNNLFFIGWWGEGIKKSGEYLINNAKKGSRVGLALNSSNTYPTSENLIYEKFDPNKTYDYILLNDFNITRLGFDEKLLDKDYEVVFREGIEGVDFSRVYKRK